MKKLIKGKDYEFVNACDVFDDDNQGYIYGIEWLDKFQNVTDCQWFKTEKARQKCIYEEEKQITVLQVLDWVGSDDWNKENFASIIADIANGDYTPAKLKQDIISYQ